VVEIRQVFCESRFGVGGIAQKARPQIRQIQNAAYTIIWGITFQAYVKSVVFLIGGFTNDSVYQQIDNVVQPCLLLQSFNILFGVVLQARTAAYTIQSASGAIFWSLLFRISRCI
jgi:hypothetical protein